MQNGPSLSTLAPTHLSLEHPTGSYLFHHTHTAHRPTSCVAAPGAPPCRQPWLRTWGPCRGEAGKARDSLGRRARIPTAAARTSPAPRNIDPLVSFPVNVLNILGQTEFSNRPRRTKHKRRGDPSNECPRTINESCLS